MNPSERRTELFVAEKKQNILKNQDEATLRHKQQDANQQRTTASH